MDQWEFVTLKFKTEGMMGGKLDTDNFDFELNKMGYQGYDLVSCFTTSQGNGYTRDVVCVFKRKKAKE